MVIEWVLTGTRAKTWEEVEASGMDWEGAEGWVKGASCNVVGKEAGCSSDGDGE